MKYLFFVLTSVVILSCGSSESTENSANAADTTSQVTVSEVPETTGVDCSQCANKTCPKCQMELSKNNGGKVADTCMVDGKIIGFCSAVCKEECMKSPEKDKLIKDCCEKK
ncbi:MAG: hypothetical protein QM539_09240 [Alphaproteobacteria bacterium]|nr:hypothetical protein [Alphaproteobacteria bacterium]